MPPFYTFYLYSKLSFTIRDSPDTLESLLVKKRRLKLMRLFARLSSRVLNLPRHVPRKRLNLLVDVPMKQSVKLFPMPTRELLWQTMARCQCEPGANALYEMTK